MNEMELEKLRDETEEELRRGNYAMRSCWECNAAHERLKEATYPISCFACGRWFYKGVDVTIHGEGCDCSKCAPEEREKAEKEMFDAVAGGFMPPSDLGVPLVVEPLDLSGFEVKTYSSDELKDIEERKFVFEDIMDNRDPGFTQDAIDEQIAELRAKPKVIQDMMRQYPPLCRVKSDAYAIPSKGAIGVVVSWFEDGKTVSVIHEDRSESILFGDVRGACEASKLVVVGYTLPFTPVWVDEVLREKEE